MPKKATTKDESTKTKNEKRSNIKGKKQKTRKRHKIKRAAAPRTKRHFLARILPRLYYHHQDKEKDSRERTKSGENGVSQLYARIIGNKHTDINAIRPFCAYIVAVLL